MWLNLTVIWLNREGEWPLANGCCSGQLRSRCTYPKPISYQVVLRECFLTLCCVVSKCLNLLMSNHYYHRLNVNETFLYYSCAVPQFTEYSIESCVGLSLSKQSPALFTLYKIMKLQQLEDISYKDKIILTNKFLLYPFYCF